MQSLLFWCASAICSAQADGCKVSLGLQYYTAGGLLPYCAAAHSFWHLGHLFQKALHYAFKPVCV